MPQEEVLQFSIDHIQEFVLLFGKDGRVTYANGTAEKLLEYGEKMGDITIADVFPSIFRISEGVFQTEFEFGEDTVMLDAYRGNRTCFPVSARIMAAEGKDDLYVCMAADAGQTVYLEKKINQVEQEAEEALKVKSQFVATVTHELRTPVNGILGNTLVLWDDEEDQQKRQVLSLIKRGCADMNAIINNILDFSKLEAGKFTLEQRKFNFREMIEYIKANHKNKITDKGLDFIVSVSPEIPEEIVGDELRIVQVLNNLLSNACKFTANGRIALEVVKTAEKENRIELFFLVIDTGIGISKEGLDKLFHSFSQVDASISRRFGGTGLGLNISKQLVELMDGSIHVESDPGKGSMFSFHIWVGLPEEEEVEAAAAEKEQQSENPAPVPVGEAPAARPVVSSANEGDEKEQEWLLEYQEPEKLAGFRKKLLKLMLCVEMDNWEKAETFADAIRQITEEAPREIKSMALRLKMSVQKSNYDKTAAAYENLKAKLDTLGGSLQ